MFDRLKAALFPCEKRMKELKSIHEKAVERNNQAHLRLIAVCGSGRECNIFPPLKDKSIVNPR